MSAGGKGSMRRPGVISDDRWNAVFGKKPAASVNPRYWPMVNTRHDIDPRLVTEQVAHKIAQHERHREESNKQQHDLVALYTQHKAEGTTARHWTREPKTDWVNPMYDSWIEREREYYAKVRVIELPQPGKRFILVYGDVDDATVTEGTGPLDTFDQAQGWFLRGGR